MTYVLTVETGLFKSYKSLICSLFVMFVFMYSTLFVLLDQWPTTVCTNTSSNLVEYKTPHCNLKLSMCSQLEGTLIYKNT